MSAVDAEGWVLAGGRSVRMGRDKAGVQLADTPLLELMLSKLRKAGLRARVAGMRNRVENVDFEIADDLHPDCGPLSGMETALSRSKNSLVVLLGVDLPFLETGFLIWMLQRAQTNGAMATIPRVQGQPQPLCAVYRRELVGRVKEALESGDYRVMAALENLASEGRLDLFDAERLATTGAWDSALPVHWQFMNCNTPEDVAKAANLLAGSPML